jgi:hypothetical protein
MALRVYQRLRGSASAEAVALRATLRPNLYPVNTRRIVPSAVSAIAEQVIGRSGIAREKLQRVTERSPGQTQSYTKVNRPGFCRGCIQCKSGRTDSFDSVASRRCASFTCGSSGPRTDERGPIGRQSHNGLHKSQHGYGTGGDRHLMAKACPAEALSHRRSGETSICRGRLWVGPTAIRRTARCRAGILHRVGATLDR